MISARTKAALAAARARGKKLGGNRGGPKVDSAEGIPRSLEGPPKACDAPCPDYQFLKTDFITEFSQERSLQVSQPRQNIRQ